MNIYKRLSSGTHGHRMNSLGLVLRSLSTWQARLMTGIAMALTAALAGATASNTGLSFAAKLAWAAPLIPTVLAWGLATISGGNAAYPHDIRLFETIMKTISVDERHFLRGHDFGNNFSAESIRGIREIERWEGPGYAFLDRALNTRWAELRKSIDVFYDLVAKTTAPQKGNVHFQTVYPRAVDPEDPPVRVILEIKALNDAASKVTRLLDAFEPIARRKLFV